METLVVYVLFLACLAWLIVSTGFICSRHNRAVNAERDNARLRLALAKIVDRATMNPEDLTKTDAEKISHLRFALHVQSIIARRALIK